jgi:tRNA uridine 5-carboxymethylaminomethyl modification enzyme
LLSPDRIERIRLKRDRIDFWLGVFETKRCSGVLWGDLMRSGGAGVQTPDAFSVEAPEIRAEVIYNVIYKGYIDRENRHVRKLGHIEKIRIPAGLDFQSIRGLRRECAQKLAKFKPFTLGQASRISGVNPSDISVLMVLIEAIGVGEREQN